MAVNPTEFDKVGEFGPVSKLHRPVKTPMPENDDGSGYTTEKNRIVVYRIGNYFVKVAKVSSRGWSVVRYEGEDIDLMETGYCDSEQKAHELAREMVEEIAEE